MIFLLAENKSVYKKVNHTFIGFDFLIFKNKKTRGPSLAGGLVTSNVRQLSSLLLLRQKGDCVEGDAQHQVQQQHKQLVGLLRILWSRVVGEYSCLGAVRVRSHICVWQLGRIDKHCFAEWRRQLASQKDRQRSSSMILIFFSDFI